MTRRHVRTLTAALSLAGAIGAAAGQVTTVSTGSGPWNAPATWSNGVPGPLDTAVVNPGDTVWLATAGVPASPSVTVDRIDVAGTLVSDSAIGQSMTLAVNALNVLPGGTVMGQNGGAAPGGSVSVEPAVPGNPLTIANDGTILGGNGVCGGNVLLYGNAPGSDLAAANTTITSNNGVFRAGDSGGGVWIAAGNITLNNATVRGGDVTPAGPNCGRSGQAGPVYISALNATFNGSTAIAGGDDLTGGPGTGGSVFVRALNNLFVDAPASVLAGTPGGPGCPGVLTYAAGTSTILGTVSPGPGVGCYVWDPPTLVPAGDLSVDAAQIILGGQTIDATGLNAATAPHLLASDRIEINLSPGGALDLRGLTPGVPYLSAPQILVNADEVLIDDGQPIEAFLDGQVIRRPARVWRDLALAPGGSFSAPAGSTVRIPLQACNVGAQPESVEFNASDTQGWMAPESLTRQLGQGFTIYTIVEVSIPAAAAPGSQTVLRVTANTADGVLEEQAISTVTVTGTDAGGPCNAADLAEPFGVLDLADINAFVAAFFNGDTDLADLDNSGVLDLNDINAFVAAFVDGCP